MNAINFDIDEMPFIAFAKVNKYETRLQIYLYVIGIIAIWT